MKLLLTGGNGMVGHAVRNFCKRNKIECVSFNSYEFDLTDPFQVEALMTESVSCSHLLHLAAKVGGVKANLNDNAGFFYENILMNSLLLEEAAKQKNFKKVLSLMSSCVYPAEGPFPLLEKNLHLGPPHESNFGYAYSKRMLDVQSRALNEKLGEVKFITAIPNNLYGKNDNYHLEDAHVVPAITRKIWESKQLGADAVQLWGDGTPIRELTYANDLAKILIWLLENYEQNEPINVGTGECKTIKDVAHIIKDALAWEEGEVLWDTTQPKGQMEKPTDNTKFRTLYEKIEGRPFTYTSIEDGLVQTSQWFVSNYPDLRGM